MRKKTIYKYSKFSLILVFLFLFTGCRFFKTKPTMQDTIQNIKVEENGVYTSKEEVAAYIYNYKKLPSNYITKPDAYALGWDPNSGNLNDIAPGKSIGGDVTNMIAHKIAVNSDAIHRECDINYSGGYRGSERIIFSNGGMIYYSPDHYVTVEFLYDPNF